MTVCHFYGLSYKGGGEGGGRGLEKGEGERERREVGEGGRGREGGEEDGREVKGREREYLLGFLR